MKILSSPRGPVAVVLETIKRMGADKVAEMSAALAYYSVLSLAPLIIVTLGVAGIVADRESLQTHLVLQADELLGHGTADLVQKLASQQHEDGTGTLATIVGVVTLLLGASAVFGQLQDGLQRVFNGMPRVKHSGWVMFVRKRLLTMAMVLTLGFLLLVSLLVSAVLSALASRVSGAQALAGTLAHLLASVVVGSLLFTLVFRFLPDTKVPWREAWAGGLATALLFQVGEWAIGRYLGTASVGSPYGAAGTLVVLLVWVYYSSLVVFASAELTHVVATRREGRVMARPPAQAGRRPHKAHAVRAARHSSAGERRDRRKDSRLESRASVHR
ncbi:MAG TPA: YihY/virulence factor BrkB family protein [Planctomycetota bacterium]|nr:YihY/virulence factor BrkB family protein [Planctomycetota bacterium]